MTDRPAQNGAAPPISPAILSTKLYRPPVSADLEKRPDLTAFLENNLHRALTLISAPAGYGKSTLASLWLDASKAPGCWVSLDENDDNPRLFLAYVLAALQSIAPDITPQVQAFLDAPVFPPPSTVAQTLLNDLERIPNRVLLVLDDLHLLRAQEIYDTLAVLLRHPSPKLHLVLISRRDPPLPIHSLRAYRQVTEIRTRDLRFSGEESVGLLATMLNRQVDEATAAAWTVQAEGWVTALSLAAIALRQRDYDDVGREDWPVNSYHLQEYLVAEVVNRLDPTVREWLLAVAWLDRFCPALCETVCLPTTTADPGDLTGEAFVQRLRNDNLFVIPLDSENHWFRLHDLFCEMLRTWGRNHFNENEIAALYCRAGAWFARQGFPDEAIRYLVSGGDHTAAEQVVLNHSHAVMTFEQWPRLQRWIEQFPEDVRENSAVLMSMTAVWALHTGQFHEMAIQAKKTEALLPALEPESATYNTVLGAVSVLFASMAIASGDAESLMTNAQRALQLLPANALLLRALACGEIAAGMQMRGRYADGYRFLELTLDEPQWTYSIRAKLMIYLCMISFMQGDLAATQAWAERARRIGKDHTLAESLCIATHFLGAVHYLRNEFDAAEPILRTLVEVQALSAQTHMVMGAFALILIYDSQGDFTRSNEILERLAISFQSTSDASTWALVEAFTVELMLRRGNDAAAQRKRIGVDFGRRPPLWFFYIPQLTPIKLLLAEGSPEALGAARSALDEFEERLCAVNRNLARIDVLVLLALVCDTQGDTGVADARLTAALDLARDGGTMRTFVDVGLPMVFLLQRQRARDGALSRATNAFVTQILAALPGTAPVQAETASPPRTTFQAAPTAMLPLEPLTERELQVIQQLAAHLSPAEIAARHVVSVSTIRSQIKSIYRKLDVRNRKEAVRRSRELNIV